MPVISGGILNSYLMDQLKQGIEDKFWQQVPIFVPTSVLCTALGCGFDAVSLSALNPVCTVCFGKGRVYTWHQGYVHVRHAWADPARIDYYRGVASGEIGDANFEGKLSDYALFKRLYETEHAYFLVDGYKLHPVALGINSVEGASGVDIRCVIESGAVP
jgi:hypothetical protein